MLFWIAVAHAGDAEANRIAESVYSALDKQNYKAVERRYRQLVAHHPMGLNARMHAAGAVAARSRGDLLTAAQRLLRVGEHEAGFTAARDDLDVLRSQMGLVMIHAESGALKPESAPFAPDHRAGIEFADARLEADGLFVGLLPVGAYTLGMHRFEVKPGFEWQVIRP